MVLPFPQTPFAHVESRVHGSPSSQIAPLFAGWVAEQIPVWGSQTERDMQALTGHVTPVQQLARQTPLAHLVNPAQHGAPAVAVLPSEAQHAPSSQAWPDTAHGVHVPPPMPQALAFATRHTFPSQQPFGQLVGSHTHVPPWQCRPAPHVSPFVVASGTQSPVVVSQD